MNPAPTPTAASPGRPRVLLGQWSSNGDCLLATTIARQIKADFPGCHLTWAIGSRFRDILRHNPYVDALWEIEQPTGGDIRDHERQTRARWADFEREVQARKQRGELDHAFLTYCGGFRNLHLYDGTVRGLLLNSYPRPITVPVDPVLRLDGAEIARVCDFVAAHPAMTLCRQVALFECSPKSRQSSMNPDSALDLSRQLLAEFDDLCIVLSSNLAIDATDERIVDASVLTFRENAELTRHCTLLIGCSSGLTWLSTSDGARRLPTVQIISAQASYPNSLAVDHERRGLPTAGILELIDPSPARAAECLRAVLREGFEAARARFHERLPLDTSYRMIGRALLGEGHYADAATYFLRTWRREGWRPRFLAYAAAELCGHAIILARRAAGAVLRRVWPGWKGSAGRNVEDARRVL